MVEGDGAVDLGAGKVERFGHERHGRLRHAAERLLQSMQDGKGCALQMPIGRDDGGRAFGIPWFVMWNAQPYDEQARKWGKSRLKSIKQACRTIRNPDRLITSVRARSFALRTLPRPLQ
jgi:hypothetical protein